MGELLAAVLIDYLEASMSAANSSKKYLASFGPGAASGWYCTENAGNVL